jgi:Mg2+ and Co2+ transporter CorA
MKISIWRDGHFRDASVADLKGNLDAAWVSILDPTVEDLEGVAESLSLPRHILVGKLRSNYPHADSYHQYTKIFAWYIWPSPARGFAFNRNPVIILTNGVSVITINAAKSGLDDRIAQRLDEEDLTPLSVPARVIYLGMLHLLEAYEAFSERLEGETEKLEEVQPPWSRSFYAEIFAMRIEGSRLLRLARHFRMLAEGLAKGNTRISFTEEETRTLDTVYDRSVAVEETTETSLETMRDLISLHLDTLSHDMNKVMRLLASITAIVAIPTIVTSLLGSNLIDEPWPWQLWQVAAFTTVIAILLTSYFYRRGWLRGR